MEEKKESNYGDTKSRERVKYRPASENSHLLHHYRSCSQAAPVHQRADDKKQMTQHLSLLKSSRNGSPCRKSSPLHFLPNPMLLKEVNVATKCFSLFWGWTITLTSVINRKCPQYIIISSCTFLNLPLQSFSESTEKCMHSSPLFHILSLR